MLIHHPPSPVMTARWFRQITGRHATRDMRRVRSYESGGGVAVRPAAAASKCDDAAQKLHNKDVRLSPLLPSWFTQGLCT